MTMQMGMFYEQSLPVNFLELKISFNEIVISSASKMPKTILVTNSRNLNRVQQVPVIKHSSKLCR